jgi:hypothetical protein
MKVIDHARRRLASSSGCKPALIAACRDVVRVAEAPGGSSRFFAEEVLLVVGDMVGSPSMGLVKRQGALYLLFVYGQPLEPNQLVGDVPTVFLAEQHAVALVWGWHTVKLEQLVGLCDDSCTVYAVLPPKESYAAAPAQWAGE